MYKKIIKFFLPQIIVKLLNKFNNNVWGYTGIYENMSSARSNATGYEADNIVQKVLTATQQVIDGKACYEREFLPAILIPACASSSPAFLMMYSAYKLKKQGDNIQP